MDRSKVITFSCVLAALFMVSPRLYSQTSGPQDFTEDSLADVKRNVDEGKAILVDVRDTVEWNAGHVRGASHLPYRELQEKNGEKLLLKSLPKDKIIYTYCAVGYRSSRAGKIIAKQKFDVRPLKPGYDDLVKAGFETERK